MREILFRGKAKAGYKWIAEGEWIEGSLFYSDDESGIVCQIATSYLSSNKDEPVMVVAYEVAPKTVCQYTGLTDKNGRKIFEGDIVKVLYTNGQEDGGDVTEVKYSEKSASFSPWDWEYDCDGCDLYFHIKEIEIVGNAFDKE